MLGVFQLAALKANIPLALLLGICSTESDFRSGVVNLYDGGSPSTGVCQLKTSTARMLGYNGTPETLRLDDEVNAIYAALYIKKQLKRYDGRICDAISSYNMGKVKRFPAGHYKNRSYVKKVLRRMKKYGGNLSKEQEAHCAEGIRDE